LEKAGSILGGGVDPSQLYLDQLKRTVGLVQQLGKRPMFWADIGEGADIFTKYPGLFSQLPKTVIAVPWQYDPKPDYSAYVAPFAQQHIPEVIATGIWCWNEIAPDFYRTIANIDGFVADGRKYGALGLINTGWTDAGQVLYRATLPAMAFGAAAAWQSQPVDRQKFFSDYAVQTYPAGSAADAASGLEKLSSAQQLFSEIMGSPENTIYRFWEDPLTPARLALAETNRDKLRQERLLAEDAQERFQRALAATHDYYSLPSLLLASRMLDYAGMKYLYAAEIADLFQSMGRKPRQSDVELYLFRGASVVIHGRVADLMDAITTLRENYRSAWRAEYTDYRLGTVLGRWDAEYEYWRRLQARGLEIFEGFKDGDTLPSLEEIRPHP
jgi:hexosaminidase